MSPDPDARELHRIITASVRELFETVRLEAQAGPMDVAEIERLIFRAAAPIVHSVAPLTEAQRGELLPNIVRVMLTTFLEEQGDEDRAFHDVNAVSRAAPSRGQ